MTAMTVVESNQNKIKYCFTFFIMYLFQYRVCRTFG